MTSFSYFCKAITTSLPVGEAISQAIDPDPNSQGAFTTGLRTVGSTSTSASAWFTASVLNARGYEHVASFLSGEYPQVLLDQGITAEQIDYARTVMIIEVGARDAVDISPLAFLAANGYEIIQEIDG